MRKLSITFLVLATLVSVGLLSPAGAAKKPRRAPVATTLYFHGSSPSGEVDSAPGLIDLTTFMMMDSTAPTDSQVRSKGYAWSNAACAGNRLFPVWIGNMAGKIIGDIKVTFTSISAPQSIDIRVWPDVFQQLCAGDYPEPAAVASVEVPAGEGILEVVIPTDGIVVSAGLMVQFSPTSIVTDTPGLGRLLYDSIDADSRIEFLCLPQSGTSCAT